MIRLNCTNCQAELTLDDAFAGGVCRCQHCGTIQTVPSHLRAGAKVAAGAKSLYQQKARGDRTGSGLDELAEVVASSGLAGSGLQQQMGKARPPARTSPASRQMAMLMWAAGGVIAVLLVVVVWLTVGRQPPAGTASPSPMPGGSPTASAARGPMFLDVPLEGTTVVYVLDRGSGTADVFSLLIEATLRSVSTLGQDRRFQIVFWSNGQSEAAYPASGTTFATPANIDAARRAINEVFAFGQTTPDTALRNAMSSEPDTLILATGKGWELDETFTSAVMGARGDRRTVVHAFSLGAGNESDAMAQVARRTGGQYRVVSETALRAARQ